MCFWKHVILFLIWPIPFLDLLYLSLNIIVCILRLNCFWCQIHVLWKKNDIWWKNISLENIPRLEFEVDLKKYILIYAHDFILLNFKYLKIELIYAFGNMMNIVWINS